MLRNGEAERSGALKWSCTTGGDKGISSPRPAAAALLFVLVTVFRFTLRAAEIFLVILGKECLYAIFTEPQAGSFIRQHEAEHHLNCQKQRVKIPHNGGPLP